MNPAAELYDYEIDPGGESSSARVLRLVGSDKHVLEIGCAAGSQTRHLKQNGCSVTGIEVNPEAAARARAFCERLIVGDIESLDLAEALGPAAFDVVILSDVLEHLRDPVQALIKVKPLVAEGGCVIASIPNVTHASVVFELMHGRFEYRNTGLLDRTHVRFFGKLGVMRLFEDAGYVVDHVERVTRDPATTEFSTKPVSQDQRRALDYVLSVNPEALTYQFVLSAVPDTLGARPTGAAGLHATARIQELENVAETQRKEISKLRSQLEWATKGSWERAFRKLRKLFRHSGAHER
jgi:2-polyprenyl-3-methyl-5-hydroxy-6-metoxy-1,4-benzoquinol methylase